MNERAFNLFQIHRRTIFTTMIAMSGLAGIAHAEAVMDAPDQPRSEQLRWDASRGEWVEKAPPEPGTAEGDLAIAQQAFGDGDYGRANRLIKKWFKSYDESAGIYPNAVLLKAKIQKARERYYEAYLTLDVFLDDYSSSVVIEEALIELFNIAEVQLSGVKRRNWMGFRWGSMEDTGLEILDEISASYANTSLAEQALKAKGDYFFANGDFGLAEIEYNRLTQEYPNSRYYRYALRRSADSALAGFAGTRFDDAPLIEAAERYDVYRRQFPGLAEQEGIGLILNDIRERRATKEFEIGRFYDRVGQGNAATIYYRSTKENWPETIAANRASNELDSGAVEPVE